MNMNRKNVCARLAIASLTAAGASAQCRVEGPEAHRFLRAGWAARSIGVFAANGKSEWKIACDDSMDDAWALPDGGTVYSYDRRKSGESGVVRLDANQKVVWDHRIKQGRNNHSCQPLPDGGFLMGVSGADGLWMVELNADGNEVKRVRVRADETPRDHHHAFRQVRKTPAGTYLGTIMCQNRTHEWDASGNVIRTFPNGTIVAIRLPNGNTLISGQGNGPDKGPVVEYDRDCKVVWRLVQADLPFHLNMPCGLQRLPNGNTVVSNVWHGKDTDRSAPMLYEITRDKKVVWRVFSTDKGNMGSFQILDVPGEVYAGEVLR